MSASEWSLCFRENRHGNGGQGWQGRQQLGALAQGQDQLSSQQDRRSELWADEDVAGLALEQGCVQPARRASWDARWGSGWILRTLSLGGQSSSRGGSAT